ncbi:P1 family peptidase [Azospirillum sp.]|uniref:P1 family peptidase n=1 Tax=Azospirillum sp. TaxID=34012 RepID=UPI002D2E3AA7|nr:P1 family peptidase [Azospirillum sp.]HYD68249.1 P1 family peptidase [Azospirillum sp.]
MRVGPRNRITDVPGLSVGNAGDMAARSGVTVVLPDEPATAAVAVLGGAPGTRETDALDPSCLVDAVHGVVLSGGSAFGLAAADGLMTWLASRGRGFRVGPAIVPVVPAAICFDFLAGGERDWGHEPPYRDLARAAADAAGADFALGNAGAGLGAKCGTLKGGLGSASVVLDDGTAVGALVVVNAFGSAVLPGTNTFWAWALEQDGEVGGQTPPVRPLGPEELDYSFDLPVGANTTIAVVATDAALTKAQAARVALMAHDGMGRALRPVHTPLDGDSVFALATGKRPLADPVGGLARIGMAAADCLSRAIMRGVYEAEALGPWPAYRDLHKTERGERRS